jgi:biopolymer transport protein ExbB/TolQ
MNALAIESLHWIAGGMLLPVVLLLLGFTAFSLLNLGGLLGEWVARLRHGAAWRILLAALKNDPARRIRIDDVPSGLGVPTRAKHLLAAAPAARDRVMDEVQVEVEHRLDRLLLGIRLGPMLGLAGTLIPLGPTLLALTAWDLSALSSQLVIAFNATVVGLFIGGACYAVHLVRRRWYRADLADLDFVVTRLEG